ncbi:zinc finger MYM-type protein 1-like [Trichonephila clavipes]|nr:zinc finger MYM-type protein 1-like [Trichonephila clavipes]
MFCADVRWVAQTHANVPNNARCDGYDREQHRLDCYSKDIGSTRYLSATIQNEMIEYLGIKLENHLIEQIRAPRFFAILMDTTQVDELSIVVRYAVITRSENGLPIDIEVKEVFLGFYAAIKQGATELFNQVTALFIDKNIDLKKCVGQGYDGASVMCI